MIYSKKLPLDIHAETEEESGRDDLSLHIAHGAVGICGMEMGGQPPRAQ